MQLGRHLQLLHFSIPYCTHAVPTNCCCPLHMRAATQAIYKQQAPPSPGHQRQQQQCVLLPRGRGPAGQPQHPHQTAHTAHPAGQHQHTHAPCVSGGPEQGGCEEARACALRLEPPTRKQESRKHTPSFGQTAGNSVCCILFCTRFQTISITVVSNGRWVVTVIWDCKLQPAVSMHW